MSSVTRERGLQLLEQMQNLLATLEGRIHDGEGQAPSNGKSPALALIAEPESLVAQQLQSLREAQTRAQTMVASAEKELEELEVALRELLETPTK